MVDSCLRIEQACSWLGTASFRMFEERGSKRVSLGVDAGNTTGATALYEKSGMKVEQRHELFQRPVSQIVEK